ncbi:MAG TPA: hypothetical protein VKB76_09395 [Ktedonobacterales bacterium]|nr:hypothetical protein [Ktedonobacterales bacterium]
MRAEAAIDLAIYLTIIVLATWLLVMLVSTMKIPEPMRSAWRILIIVLASLTTLLVVMLTVAQSESLA